MNCRLGISKAILVLLVAGCATMSTDSYPILDQTKDSDSAMTCAAIAGDFQGASNLRSEIIAEHGDTISDAITGTVWSAVMNPAAAISKGVWTAADVSAETSAYARATAAAGLRMEQLLRYKREKDCTETPSRDPSLTDDQILTLLDELLGQYEAGEIDEKEYLLQREKFLNKLLNLNY